MTNKVEQHSYTEQLLRVGIALSAEKDHFRLLELIVTEARGIAKADAGTLYLRKEDQLAFGIVQNETLGLFSGGHDGPLKIPPVALNRQSVSAIAAIDRKTINIPDVYGSTDYDLTGPRKYDEMTGYCTKSMLVVPLVDHESRVIGVLQLINAKTESGDIVPFSADLEEVITALASQAAVALANMLALKRQREFGFMFTSIVMVISLYSFLVGAFGLSSAEHGSANLVEFVASRVLELAVLGVVVVMVRNSEMSLRSFGLTLTGWKTSLREAMWVSGLVLVGMVVVKYWLQATTELFPEGNLFLWQNFNFSYVTYLIVAPLQEFVTRGVFQSTIERLLTGRYAHVLAIANTSFVFGALHLHSSLNLAMMAFATSWLWGVLYSRNRTLVGVSVSHFLIGNAADLLGFWAFF